MRVAVSDYDGTLCLERVVSAQDLEGIRAWRAAGNVFGLATGRDLSMIMYEINRWSIPFDFLLCCNGGACYDAELNILAQSDIDASLVAAVLEHTIVDTALHYEMGCNGETLLCIRSQDSWFLESGCPYTPVSIEEASKVGAVQQIGLAYRTHEEAVSHGKVLSCALGHALEVHANRRYLDVTAKEVSKEAAVRKLLALRQWPEEGLLVIGDGDNDLGMIRDFQGYAVHGSKESIVCEAQGVYSGVGEMLRAHL